MSGLVQSGNGSFILIHDHYWPRIFLASAPPLLCPPAPALAKLFFYSDTSIGPILRQGTIVLQKTKENQECNCSSNLCSPFWCLYCVVSCCCYYNIFEGNGQSSLLRIGLTSFYVSTYIIHYIKKVLFNKYLQIQTNVL